MKGLRLVGVFECMCTILRCSKDDLTNEGIETRRVATMLASHQKYSKDDLTYEGMNGGEGRKAKGERQKVRGGIDRKKI